MLNQAAAARGRPQAQGSGGCLLGCPDATYGSWPSPRTPAQRLKPSLPGRVRLPTGDLPPALLVDFGGPTTTSNYGLGFDPVGNVLWTYDDDTQELISIQ